MTRVININTSTTKKYVYVGRGSLWGNPYIIGTHGNRLRVIKLYKKLLYIRLTKGSEGKSAKEWREAIMKLEGKVLGCYCYPDPCHANVIVDAINALKENLIPYRKE